MICFEVNGDKLNRVEDLGDYLNLNDNKVLSIVGAGGKTTLLYYLANSEGKKGKEVICLTSTQMYCPDECFMPEGEIENINEKFSSSIENANMFLDSSLMLKNAASWNYFITGIINKSTKKLHAPSSELYKEILNRADNIIIESDGSKRMPIKALREGEPVIFKETNICLIVMGLSALNKRIKDVCARSDIACDILDKKENEMITEEDFAKLIKESYFKFFEKNFPNIKFVPIINQVDDSKMMANVKQISKYLEMPILASVMEPSERKDIFN